MPNAHRISTARHALIAATWARGVHPDIGEQAVIDLVTDLMHFCAGRRIAFDACTRAAADQFKAEIAS